jgi:hypothetical protein
MNCRCPGSASLAVRPARAAAVCACAVPADASAADGTQVMRYTFDAFSHLRASVDVPAACVPYAHARARVLC